MKLDFDIENVSATEFGVGRDDGNGQTFVSIPVDADVQNALREMVSATWQAMQQDIEATPPRYEPADKHGGVEYLYLPLRDEMARTIRELHEANNLPLNADALAEPAQLFCYFARLTDNKQRRLTALRRAIQFKGVLKSRLLRLVTDSLKLVEDRVFKLDSDFDLLVDSTSIHILRPSSFEFAGKLQEAILSAVATNAKAIQQDLPFVSLANVEEYASRHPRAARYLASIRVQTKNVDKRALKNLCKQTGVDVTESGGKIIVEDGYVMGFLEVLDRRRYELELVKNSPERFRAGSRQRIDS